MNQVSQGYGLILVIVGILLVVFSDRASRYSIQSQNKTWGFHFGERERKFSRVLWILGGIVAFIMGILTLFGIIHFARG